MFVTIRIEEEEERVEKILMVFCYTLGLHTQYNNNNNNITQCSYFLYIFVFPIHSIGLCACPFRVCCILYSIQDYGERRVRRILIRNRCQLGERTFSLFFQGAATGFIVFRCLGAFTGRLYQPAYTHTHTLSSHRSF